MIVALSGNTPWSSVDRAALTFCFFCVKAKEKRRLHQGKRKEKEGKRKEKNRAN
ncbi:hypothetical protein [uncultured Bacteroides sp.]|uniref:hypothetical protein n=1 Tax=uncultured Bacteroides sp. TaxID=162156 RepID=UPI002AA85159|nr:hypothetical protein [uncultured Bacteroides sp.]